MDLRVWSFVIPVVIVFPLHVAAFYNGKIESACYDMVPRHPYPIQDTTAPYTLTMSKTSYVKGEKIRVILKMTSANYPIAGFMIQAREVNSNTPLGSFEISGSEVQTLTCTTPASAVSHTSNISKSVVMVTWVAPTSNISNIQLRATVVSDISTFWTNVVGPNLIYAGSGGSKMLASVYIMCTTVLVSDLIASRL